jgi:hypothetical protein
MVPTASEDGIEEDIVVGEDVEVVWRLLWVGGGGGGLWRLV